MTKGLKGKTALVTGINNPQGIGAATAFALAGEGADLVLAYKRTAHSFDSRNTARNGLDRYHQVNAGDASAVEARLRAMNADFLTIETDITCTGHVVSLYDQAIARFGKVDILVNNAAHADDDDTIETLTEEAIDLTLGVNLRGTLLMIREFVRRGGAGGSIVNLSTDAAQVFSGQIVYGASKAALEALTRSLAIDLAKYDITVNCVAPGPTQTGWIDQALEAAILPDMPLGRLIQPHEIAEAIVFLTSSRARSITGQVIKVSGGHQL
ncbi:MAG: SDR family NAD(P)-dependent oxidoreductase [Christensenellales bacterium]